MKKAQIYKKDREASPRDENMSRLKTHVSGLKTPLAVLLAVVIGIAGFGIGLLAPQGSSAAGAVSTTTITKTVTIAEGVTPRGLSGEIVIDGSSTVYPITEAAAEAFMARFPDVSISVGISGTGGGFKRFVVGETDINDASRPILHREAERARSSGVEWIEVPVAIDGLTVVVNRENTFVDCLTISELKKIWEPESSVKKWSHIRPGWPDEKIILYGPGADSGTFDYFTERVVGKTKASRTDYIASEDDNVLVAGVEGQKNALGYFGYAYYATAVTKIRAVPVKDDAILGAGCVEPSDETVMSGLYPLSRPIFIYVNKKAWDERPEIREFVYFYVENGYELASKVKYTPFPKEYYTRALAFLKAGILNGLIELTKLEGRDAGPAEE